MAVEAEGWFVHAAAPGEEHQPAEPVRARYEVAAPGPHEVLLEPLYASWEANIHHALARSPIDTCRVRGVERAVIGNAGVARVLACGPGKGELAPDSLVLPFGVETDRFGYPERIMGYDSRLSGLLTTRLVLREDQLIPLPRDTRHDAKRWAAFSNRYATAWANWRVAHGVLRLLIPEEELPRLHVWGWGGGTAFAEVQLAARQGHHGVVISSRADRRAYAERVGLAAVDRAPFADLAFDFDRYRSDAAFRATYGAAEEAFLAAVRERTDGEGVHVFVEPIGPPVFRATLKALAREGVLTTFGWRDGMATWYLRAVECIRRHQIVHTHFARRQEVLDAVAFAEEHEWLPEVDARVWSFDEVPELAASYAQDRLGLFSVCRVNPE